MVKFHNHRTLFEIGIVFTLYFVVVSSSPKPFLLINKGQINVRDSVQRLGHVHSRSSGGRSKYFDFLGGGFMSRAGRETDFQPMAQPAGVTTSIEAGAYSKGDISDEVYGQPMDLQRTQPRGQGQKKPKPRQKPTWKPTQNNLTSGGRNQPKQQQNFQGNKLQNKNQAPEGYSDSAEGNQQQDGQIQGQIQNQQPGYISNYGQQPNYNYGGQPVFIPNINPLAQEQFAIGSYGAHLSNGKRRGLKGLIHGIRGRLVNTLDNVKRAVRNIIFKRERPPVPVAVIPTRFGFNRHVQFSMQQPQGNLAQANHGDIQKLEASGGSGNNNYYFVSGPSGHQRRRTAFSWDRDRERRCPRWLRLLCPLA